MADNIDPEEWYKWFRDLNKPQFTINKWDKTVEGVVKRLKDFTCFNEGLDKNITNDEIIKASRRLKNHKAVGYDSICNEMIKCLVKTRFINVVRSLFNAICLKSYFPKLWKISYITLIFKDDDSFDPNNYRGISVSRCLGKLFTLILNERLIKFFNDKKVLSDCQIGFKRNYRTSDHIFILNTVLNSYFSRGKRLYACFVDFSKAYDSVWRVGLLYKLILNGLSTKFIHLVKSMYEDLQLSVKLSDGVTPFFDSLLGVWQGCNLSPLLFNLFVNDIFQELKDNSCEPIKLQQKDINCLCMLMTY